MIISLLLCVMFLVAHSFDHASMDSYVNTHSAVSFRLMITTVHASHVMMCGMFIMLMGCNIGMTLGIIMLAYCHLVEVLWLAIMSVTMLMSASALSNMAIVTNHLLSYPVPSNVTYKWAVGLTLTVVFILRIVSGMVLVTEPMLGVLHILVHMILSNMGRIAPGVHAIGSTMVMGLLLLHMLR